MNRRYAIKALAGLAAGSTWAGRAGAFPGSADDVPLPELARKLTATMDSIPIRVEGLAPGLSLISGPGGNVAALAGPNGVVGVALRPAQEGRIPRDAGRSSGRSSGPRG